MTTIQKEVEVRHETLRSWMVLPLAGRQFLLLIKEKERQIAKKKLTVHEQRNLKFLAAAQIDQKTSHER